MFPALFLSGLGALGVALIRARVPSRAGSAASVSSPTVALGGGGGVSGSGTSTAIRRPSPTPGGGEGGSGAISPPEPTPPPPPQPEPPPVTAVPCERLRKELDSLNRQIDQLVRQRDRAAGAGRTKQADRLSTEIAVRQTQAAAITIELEAC